MVRRPHFDALRITFMCHQQKIMNTASLLKFAFMKQQLKPCGKYGTELTATASKATTYPYIHSTNTTYRGTIHQFEEVILSQISKTRQEHE